MKNNKGKAARELFDNYAEYYDLHMKSTGHYKAQLKILKELSSEIKEPILDLACGPGFLLEQLKRKFKLVFANDVSLRMLSLAKEKTKMERQYFSSEDATTLSTHKQKFSTIICCNLFFYLENPEKAIRRWKELLTEKGRMILIEEEPFRMPTEGSFTSSYSGLLKVIKPKLISEIKEIFAKEGLRSIKEKKAIIDSNHNLWGLVFELR